MGWDFISNLLLASIRMATPLIFLSLAELYSQRAGLVHIGLEGLASIGSLVGFLVSLITGNPLLGVLASAAAGILVNMIYAYATITLCAEQIVYGMAINIFAPALAAFIYRAPIPPLPPLSRRCDTAVRQIELAARDKGEHIAILEARKQYAWYLKGVPHAGYYKEQIVRMNTLEDVYRVTEGIRRDLT